METRAQSFRRSTIKHEPITYTTGLFDDGDHEYDDQRDWSVHPSYTRFSVPYNIVCARRYAQKRLMYEQQFEHEIRQLINYMDSGASAVIFARHVAYTTLWPPLHTRTEIKRTEKFFRLNKKQQKRLNYLMENVID